jgi:nucleoid-associated protein EbfC
VFDVMKNLGSIAGLLSQAGKMREKMQAMQDNLARKEITADAKLELISLKIDRAKLDLADSNNLEDLIVAAVRAAQSQAAEMMKQELQKAAAEAGLPPGLLG